MRILVLIFLLCIMTELSAQSNYNQYPVYNGELGLKYSKTKSSFRIWSPPAEAVQLLLYKEGENGTAFKTIDLKKEINGTWHTTLDGDFKGTFYVFRVKINNKWNNEMPDPYAKAVGINGKRAMVINLKDTDPHDWINDKSPAFSKQNNPVDAVIYELHVRDASIDDNSGIKHKGKF